MLLNKTLIKKTVTRQITQKRKIIDKLDATIIKLLNHRLRIAQYIVNLKRKYGLPITSSQREKQIINKLQKISKNKDLKKEIPKIYKIIFRLSKK
ncbi:MAG: hypothetical protein KatS3mg097_594 [Candidatus Parcubacteria bacterium]|nr:MAG: hypothetical protein KatS3mg097_594 [Candidatus Parcubacteria bacterium]